MVSANFTQTDSCLLVDGHNLLLRIFFSKLKEGLLLTSDELIYACCNIFINQIIICNKRYNTGRIYIAFDRGGSLRKKSIYSEYKTNRTVKAGESSAYSNKESTEIFVSLLDKCISLCRILNIPVFYEYGIEADDMIGIAAEHLSQLGKQIIILSNDSDFLQLLKYDNVVCSIPYKKMDVSKNNFSEYFSQCSKSKGVNITPWEYVFYKSIVGDTSDNIVGIPGIGYKKLHKLVSNQLLNQSEQLTSLYMSDGLEYLESVIKTPNSKFEILMNEHVDIIRRNYKLIELSTKYVSNQTISLTANLLLNASDRPNKLKAIRACYELFNTNSVTQFITNSLLGLSSIYVR